MGEGEMPNFYLTGKLPSYLLRLDREYEKNSKEPHRTVIRNCRAIVIPETDFDNYNGGMHGHDARLYVPLDVHSAIPLKEVSKVAEAICSDLNQLAQPVQNEFFRAVVLEVDDENDADYQKSIPFLARPPLNPDTLAFWRPGHVRLFISHRDGHKIGAKGLAQALETYGISSFVAHDTIKPLTEWRHEILKALETMEIMLVYLTNDFEDSIWTQQEVGYALGKGIPVVSLKLDRKDPPGFISHVQAQKGSNDDPAASASALYKLIAECLGAVDRLHDGLVSAFVMSEDFNDARYRFDRMAANVDRLNPAQLESIIRGYRDNANLHNAFYLSNQYRRLVGYLTRVTGTEYRVEGVNILAPPPAESDDEVPF
jgi:TIR domain